MEKINTEVKKIWLSIIWLFFYDVAVLSLQFWISEIIEMGIFIQVRDCKGKMKMGKRMKPKNLRRWTIHIRLIRHLSDITVSRNLYKTVSNLYENSYTYNFLIKVVGLSRSYSANTKPIWKRIYPTETWESQVCSRYDYLIFIFNF